VPYLAFSLLAIPLPLTPIQILSIDMGTDSLTALGLGVEPPGPDVMRRPPRRPGERLFSVTLALRAYLLLGGIEALAAMATSFFVLAGGGWQYGQRLASDDPLYLARDDRLFERRHRHADRERCSSVVARLAPPGRWGCCATR